MIAAETAVALRLVLAAVFALAAAGKLMDLSGSRSAVEQFGLPRWLAEPVGTLLPVLEGALAILLVLDPTARTAAVAACLVFAVFVAAIARLMVRGQEAECHCFGVLHSARVGWPTLVRNLLLVAIGAGLALTARQGEITGWVAGLHGMAALAAGEGAALLAVTAAAGMFALAMLRRHGALLLRIDALEGSQSGAAPASVPAPAFTLAGLHGDTVTLQSLLAPGRPLMLLFTDPGCGPCNALMPEVAHWQSEHAGRLSIALISAGSAEENRRKASEHGVRALYLQDGPAVRELYGISGTPSAVLVRPDGHLDGKPAAGADAIRGLLRRALAPHLEVRSVVPAGSAVIAAVPTPAAPTPAPPVPLPVGNIAPRRRLRALSGRTIRLDSSRSETLLVFWNPGCGFCERLEPELAAWEGARDKEGPALVVIADGPEDANRTLPFRGPVVLDPGGRLMREFGAQGTPSAVLVDAHGRIASSLAVGGPEVMVLASSSPVRAASGGQRVEAPGAVAAG